MDQGTHSPNRTDETPTGLTFNICDLETSHKFNSGVKDLDERVARSISSELQYSCKYWLDHLLQSEYCDVGTDGVSAEDRASILGLLADFLETKRSLFGLEALSLTGSLDVGRTILLRILGKFISTCSSFLTSERD